MTKFVTMTGIWKPALRRWTERLNIDLGNGWKLGEVHVHFYGLFDHKYLLIARLIKEDSR